MKILSEDFNAKVRRQNILKLTFVNDSLLQDSNDNGVRTINFATSRILVVKSTIFPHPNVHKYPWTCPEGKTHKQMITY